MEDFEGDRRHAKYSIFNVASETDLYRATMAGYSGDSGICKSLIYSDCNRF